MKRQLNRSLTRRRSIVACLLVAAALGLGYAGLGVQHLEAQAKPQAAKTAVAVVNVNDLIAKSQQNIDFQAELQKRRAALQQESEAKQKKINLMRQDLDVMPNAEARAKKESEIIEAIANFQAWSQVQQQYLQRDQQTFLAEIYTEIRRTVATVAQREGYDVVLLDAPSPDFSKLNAEQLVQVIGGRQVIYRTNRVDLTPVVLEQMNLNHLNRGDN